MKMFSLSLSGKTWALLVAGLFPLAAGLLLMYDSGFLFDPGGNVVCSGLCDYYQYVYPLKRGEFWIGLFVFMYGFFPLGIVAYRGHSARNRFSDSS